MALTRCSVRSRSVTHIVVFPGGLDLLGYLGEGLLLGDDLAKVRPEPEALAVRRISAGDEI
jgi:hypothetical protein